MRTRYNSSVQCLSVSERHIPGTLAPGQVDICHFRLLMTIGKIRKQHMQDALEDVLVRGQTRREACERHGVSQSQFSVKYRYLQMVNQTVIRIYPFIAGEIRTAE